MDKQESAEPTPLLSALCFFVTLLGRKTNENDLLVGLPAFDGDLPKELVSRTLERVGLRGRVEKNASFHLNTFPVCIGLKNNKFVTVIGVEKNDYLIADPLTQGGYERFDKAVVEKQFTGFKVEAYPSIEDMYERHVGKNSQGHWFWSWIYSQKRNIFDVIAGSFVANLLAVAVSLFALQVYDRVIPNQSNTTLWVLAVGVSFAIIMEGILRTTRAHIMDVVGRCIELEVSSFLFERLLGMRLSSRPASPGSLVYMVREFGSVREFFTASSIGTVADIPFVLIFLLLIYVIAGHIVWIVVLGALIMILPSLFAQKVMVRLSKEMLGGTTASGKLLTEVCYSQETVKAAHGERFFQRRWEEINALNAVKTTDQRSLAASLTYWAAGIQQFTYTSTVVAGVYYIFDGKFTIGTIIATSILTGRTLVPITQLSGTLARWYQVRTSLEGLEQIVSTDQERPSGKTFARRSVLRGDLRLKEIKFYYDENAPSNLNISQWNVNSEDIIGLLGANGSGKSTLLKIMSGLYSINTGSISIDGLDYRQVDPSDMRRNIGYLPQEIKLFNGTLRDNLNLGRLWQSDEQLFEALSFAGLDTYVQNNANGLDLLIADGGDGLSVGQRQCLGLARLYLQDPTIILMDEPTASMDHVLESKLIDILQPWLLGRTCIIATHRMPILHLVNRLSVLQNGSIVMDGEKEKVLEKLKKPSYG